MKKRITLILISATVAGVFWYFIKKPIKRNDSVEKALEGFKQ